MSPSPAIRVFASHDWGKEGVNHKAVARVVAELRKKGMDVWFDETHMKGNILDAMCRGIDASDVVLVFVTTAYLDKVQSGNDSDNVRREFMYATQRPEKLLAIRFDSELPGKWHGPVGMLLGSSLYHDMTTVTENTVNALVQGIRNTTSTTRWKTAVAKVTKPLCLVDKQRATKASPPVPDVRKRVRRVVDCYGVSQNKDERSVQVLDRILESIRVPATGTTMTEWTLIQKLEWVERQLGL